MIFLKKVYAKDSAIEKLEIKVLTQNFKTKIIKKNEEN
jgi:hypothetical protein